MLNHFSDMNKIKSDVANNGTIIRVKSANDTESIMRIWLETNIRAHDFINENYWKNKYHYVKTLISESEVYVYEKSGQVIGFIGLSGDYIAGLFVTSDFQSRGIGKKLLDYVKTFKPKLYLSVYQKNCNAVRFYQREGFVKESESVDENTGEQEYVICMK